MKIEIIRCDKCKDAILGSQMYSVTGPYISWDLCQKCYYLLKGWADDADEMESEANGNRTLQAV
jgi:hypothetical protein